MAEQPLDGGIANAGAVTRDGDDVLRPASSQAASIHAFLRALRDAGFEGAPLPVGIDPDGRERLEYIEGDVPLSPYPRWSQSDAALVSVGQLLRRFHDASRAFDPAGQAWRMDLADPAGGDVVCHNDLEQANVVFRHGVAVGFIDFEFAAPGRPVYDLAHVARHWIPIDHPIDRERMGWPSSKLRRSATVEVAERGSDSGGIALRGPARLRLLADAYGLDAGGRTELLSAVTDASDVVEAAVRRSVAAGNPGAVALWNRTGGQERFDRRRRAWTEQQDAFRSALT